MPLPKPFPLPDNFSPIVMAGLKVGALSGKAMTKFITEVASSIYRYSAYPTKVEKEHVAIQCIKKYPFLESSCGNGFVSCLQCMHGACYYSGVFCEIFYWYAFMIQFSIHNVQTQIQSKLLDMHELIVSGSDKRVHLVKNFETRFLTSFDSYIIGERVSVGSA